MKSRLLLPRILLAAILAGTVAGAYEYGRRQGAPDPASRPVQVAQAGDGATAGAGPRDPEAAASRPAADTLRFEPGSAQASNVVVERLRRVAIPVALPVNGRVGYDEAVTARVAAPVAGRVVAIRRDVGDAVAAGDALVDIDAPDVATALAEHRKAQADHARARAAAERGRMLLEGEVIARKEFEAAQADAQQAAAELRRTEQRLQSLRVAPGSASPVVSLRAPLSGTVTERQVNPGQQLGGDPQTLMVVSDLSRLWVQVDLPERDLARVAPGQRVQIEVDAFPDDAFPGRVTRIGAVVDPTTRRVPVRVEVSNTDRRLKPEMFARVSFLSTAGEMATRVPNDGLVDLGANAYVFLETAPDTFRRTPVQTLLRDRDATYVSGLPADARVVTQGALLIDGELGTR